MIESTLFQEWLYIIIYKTGGISTTSISWALFGNSTFEKNTRGCYYHCGKNRVKGLAGWARALQTWAQQTGRPWARFGLLDTKNNQSKNQRLTARFHVQILHPLFESKWILLSAKITCSIELPPWKSTKLCVSITVYWIRIPLCTLQGAEIISNWVSAEPRGLLKFLCHFHEHCLQLLHAVAFFLCLKQKKN